MLGVIEFRMALQSDDYEALAAFRYGMRKFLRFSKDVLAGAKLTPEQYEALLAIKASDQAQEPTIGDLSERLQVKHHTAVSLIDKLAGQKLVSRVRSTEDRRRVHLRLTARGDSILSELAAVHRREIRRRCPEILKALRRLQQ